MALYRRSLGNTRSSARSESPNRRTTRAPFSSRRSRRAGVTVGARGRANPVQVLPTQFVYGSDPRCRAGFAPVQGARQARLEGQLQPRRRLESMLFGVSQGVTTEAAALAAEQNFLATRFGIPKSELRFVDGSGGGDTTATNEAVIAMLVGMSTRPSYAAYLDSQPRLGIDGSLSFVTDFAADPSLAGAKGQVRAKTGTYVTGDAQGRPVIRSQALAGYIDARKRPAPCVRPDGQRCRRDLGHRRSAAGVPGRGNHFGDPLKLH